MFLLNGAGKEEKGEGRTKGWKGKTGRARKRRIRIRRSQGRTGERKEGEENETVDEGIEKREIRKTR
jgi:hypothetical protein